MGYEEDDSAPTLGEVLREALTGQETILDLANDTEGGKKIVLQRRNINPEAPVKAPSPRRKHTLYDVEGFAAYLKKFGGDKTVVLADPEAGRMAAVLDETATTGFEVVHLVPQLHPLFKPWDQALKTPEIAIRDFVNFVASNRMTIAQPAGRELLLSIAQVRMSREVELYQGSGTTALNGVLIRTKVDGGTDRSEHFDLPESITIKTPLFVATDAVELSIDMILGGTEQKGVFVRLSSGDLVQKKVEAFERMFNIIRGACPDVTLGMGKPEHEDWKTLPTA